MDDIRPPPSPLSPLPPSPLPPPPPIITATNAPGGSPGHSLSRLTLDHPDGCLGIIIPSAIPPKPNPTLHPTQPNPTGPSPNAHALAIRGCTAGNLLESCALLGWLNQYLERPRPAWLFGSTDVKSRAWLGVTRTYLRRKGHNPPPTPATCKPRPISKKPTQPRLPTAPSLSYPARRPSQSLSRSPS